MDSVIDSFTRFLVVVTLLGLVLIFLVFPAVEKDHTPVFPENPVSNVVDIRLTKKQVRTVDGSRLTNKFYLSISNKTGHDIDGLTWSDLPDLFTEKHRVTLLAGRHIEFPLPEINSNETIIVVGAQGHDPIALYTFKDAQGNLTILWLMVIAKEELRN